MSNDNEKVMLFKIVDHNVDDFTITYSREQNDNDASMNPSKVYQLGNKERITEDMWIFDMRRNDKE